MSLPYLRSILLAATAIAITFPAHAELQSRLYGAAVYDTSTNLTWLTNANLIASNTFGLQYGVSYGVDSYGYQSIIRSNGLATWGGAEAWVAAMDGQKYLGFSDWRLPTVSPLNGSTFNYGGSYKGQSDNGMNVSAPGTLYAGSKASEMAYLFFNDLGNKAERNAAGYPQGGFGVTNSGPFQGLSNSYYWSGTVDPKLASTAWYFEFQQGYQGTAYKGGPRGVATITDYERALVLRTGDVLAPVPEPETYAMLLAGLGLIGAIAFRRKAKQA
jgi:hypothetical protein